MVMYYCKSAQNVLPSERECGGISHTTGELYLPTHVLNVIFYFSLSSKFIGLLILCYSLVIFMIVKSEDVVIPHKLIVKMGLDNWY